MNDSFRLWLLYQSCQLFFEARVLIEGVQDTLVKVWLYSKETSNIYLKNCSFYLFLVLRMLEISLDAQCFAFSIMPVFYIYYSRILLDNPGKGQNIHVHLPDNMILNTYILSYFVFLKTRQFELHLTYILYLIDVFFSVKSS